MTCEEYRKFLHNTIMIKTKAELAAFVNHNVVCDPCNLETMKVREQQKKDNSKDKEKFITTMAPIIHNMLLTDDDPEISNLLKEK